MYRHQIALATSLLVLVVTSWTAVCRAETVEIFPSFSVEKHRYEAPLNEQPFYGFARKSELMLAADREFIAKVEKNTGREIGAEQFEGMGWSALRSGDHATAARRFNQAWLLSPGRSASVHGLAVVAANRFGDIGFAIELVEVASRMRHSLPTLPGDHGGLLIRAGRPGLAIPFLEKAVAEIPSWINPQINLATARYEIGDVDAACRQLVRVERMLQERPEAGSATIEAAYRSLSKQTRCKSD